MEKVHTKQTKGFFIRKMLVNKTKKELLENVNKIERIFDLKKQDEEEMDFLLQYFLPRMYFLFWTGDAFWLRETRLLVLLTKNLRIRKKPLPKPIAPWPEEYAERVLLSVLNGFSIDVDQYFKKFSEDFFNSVGKQISADLKTYLVGFETEDYSSLLQLLKEYYTLYSDFENIFVNKEVH